MQELSKAERRRYISERINTDWGWVDYEKGPNGYSYRDITNALTKAFGSQRGFNPMTIKRDIESLREEANTIAPEVLSEAQLMLAPDRFPEWRKKLRGDGYETPKYQLALFLFLRCLAHKEAVPQWVLDYFDELDPIRPFPPNLNELIVNQEKLLSFAFLLAPRHGKTDDLQDFIIHEHCEDPNIKILYGNGTIHKTQSFTANYFMPVLEHHEWLNEMYGPFKSDDRQWSKSGYVLAKRTGFHKSSSLQPFGISGSVLSLDADLILADDISDLRRALSEKTTDDDFDWLTTQLMTRREPHTAFAYVGSHVAVETGDLFERLESKKDELNTGDHILIIKKIPAHDYLKCDLKNDPEHTKCVLWPTKRPYSFLEAMRGLMGDDAMFEAVYNQVPRQRKMMHFPADVLRSPYPHLELPEGATVTPPPSKDGEVGVLDYQRSWRQLPIYCCKKETAVGLGFDPAASESKGASFTALAVIAACTRCGRRYWVDYQQERMSPEGHPEFIEQFVREYPQIEVATIEVNAYQKSLARDPRVDDLQNKYKFYVKEWTTDERKHDPDFGIPQYGRHYKSGMVSIPFSTIYDQEFAEPLIKTFIRWPQKPNDLVMAGWLADRGLEEIIESTRYSVPERMAGTDQWRTQWHDENTFEVDLSDVFDEEWIGYR